MPRGGMRGDAWRCMNMLSVTLPAARRAEDASVSACVLGAEQAGAALLERERAAGRGVRRR